MENILPCPPRDLPKLADKTVLTLPITISIATSLDLIEVSFWQSREWYLILKFIVSMCLLGFGFQFWIYIFSTASEKHFNWLISISLPILAIVIMGMILLLNKIYFGKNGQKKYYKMPKNSSLGNWKSEVVLKIEKEQIILFKFFHGITEYAKMSNIINFQKYSTKVGMLGFFIVFKSKKTSTCFLRSDYFFLINDQYLIKPLEILNLLNNVKKTNSNQITFLSMDNDENLMDIGW